MKSFTTSKPGLASLFYFPASVIFLFASVSCAETVIDTLNKDSEKYLSFYETVDGESIHWEVNFEGGEIISIYKNGKKVPDDLVDDYKDKVYDQLDEMRFGCRRFTFGMPFSLPEDFGIDMEEQRKNLEELQEKFKDFRWDPDEFKFDDEKLKEQMDELKERLEKHKFDNFWWKFDDEKFKEHMKKPDEYLKEHLPKPEKFRFYFWWEEEEDTEV